MISVIYWIVNIVLSLVFQSWTLFLILGAIWLFIMIIRFLAKSGLLGDGIEGMFDGFSDFDGGSCGSSCGGD